MKKIDFVYLFDVQDGNPNGDPDRNNQPRVDDETSEGIVTDVCLKRKVRNYVQSTMGAQCGYEIFIQDKTVLNTLINEAYEKASAEGIENPKEQPMVAAEHLCKRYFDVRTFGALLTHGKNSGQVRGPIQLTFARSVDPVSIMETTITRKAITNEDRAEDQATMGRKYTIPYGLYICHGFISASLAKQTGFSDEDLSLFWEALRRMFDIDRASGRGLMSAQRLIVFKHDSELGSTPANKLFDLVKVERKVGVEVPRCFGDYEVTVDTAALPANVHVDEEVSF